jgi:hypothetical protein
MRAFFGVRLRASVMFGGKLECHDVIWCCINIFSRAQKNETRSFCGNSKKAEKDISVNWTVQLYVRSKLLCPGSSEEGRQLRKILQERFLKRRVCSFFITTHPIFLYSQLERCVKWYFCVLGPILQMWLYTSYV